eukprot:scaffold8030_cov62-Attheya_sp.AAC.4
MQRPLMGVLWCLVMGAARDRGRSRCLNFRTEAPFEKDDPRKSGRGIDTKSSSVEGADGESVWIIVCFVPSLLGGVTS